MGCLASDGKLAGEEVGHLQRLVSQRDARLLAAYDAYVDSQDVDDLVDTMMRVAQREQRLSSSGSSSSNGASYAWPPPPPPPGAASSSSSPHSAAVASDEHSEEPAASSAADDAPSVASVFAGIVERGALSQVEIAALQVCVSRNDVDLATVLEVYGLELDEQDLEDSLKRVARKTIDKTIETQWPKANLTQPKQDSKAP